MTESATKPARPERIAWIDLLRGLAVIGMVETHVLNTFLSTQYDESDWRGQLSFFNGLLAPTFLWIAGFMQGGSVRRIQQRGQPVFSWARMRRIGLVALLGFLMSAPLHLWGLGQFTAEGWEYFWRVNILPCMALSLAMLLLAGHFGGRRHDLVVTVLMMLSVFGAPLVAHIQTGLLPLDAFLNREGGSLFPWFPWFGFAATGYLASRWPVRWNTHLPAAAGLIGLATVLEPDVFSNAHPYFFFERLGWVGIMMLAVRAFSFWSAPRWMLLAGRESLFLYVIHLLLIHCTPVGGTTLDRWVGQTQSLAGTLLIYVVILGASMLLAWANDWRKRSRKEAVVL